MADISLRINADFAAAEKAFKTTGFSAEQMASKIDAMKKKLTPEHIDNFTKKLKLSAAAMTATRGPMSALGMQSKLLQKEIERLIKSGINPEDVALKKLRDQYVSVNKQIDASTKKTSKLSNTFKSVTGGIIAANLLQKAVRGVGSGFTFMIDEARKVEDATASFTPLMGSVEKAKQLVDQMNIAAAETPYRFQNISKTVSQLLPVMNGDIEKTISTFKMLGDTAGGNTQKLASITKGYTKAMLKTKVDMESLNMIAEAGVPIFGEMATIMGFGKNQMGQFFKTISSGKVSTDILTQTFKKMTSEGGLFFQGMIIASKTTSGVLSTLSDNIGLTAGSLGKLFLPMIKEGALQLIKVTGAIRTWINDGDNLKNMLGNIKDVLTAVAAGVAAYAIATGVAALASYGLGAAFATVTSGIKAMTIAMATNPIGLIAVGVTLLVLLIVKLVKHWDLVKFKVIDFAQSAQIKMISFAITIREKVMGAVAGMLKQLSKLPLVGKYFKSFAKSQQQYTNRMKQTRDQLIKNQKVSRAAWKETSKNKKSEKELNDKIAKQTQKNNKLTTASNAKKESQLKQFMTLLKSIPQIQDDINVQEQLAAERHFQNIADKNVKFGESKIEFLKRQAETIKNLDFKTNEERLNAEKGLQAAIKKEQMIAMQSKLNFAADSISLVGNIMSDVQQILSNAGKESYGLAVAMKAVAMAEAGINTALAFTKALASVPYPYNFLAAGMTLAAGVAQEVKIASTPIPRAETGLSNYTVPDSRTNKFDGAAIMAQGGETVDVTPRGQNKNKDLTVNIQIADETIYKVVQVGIDTGQINVTDRNIGNGVFAV